MDMCLSFSQQSISKIKCDTLKSGLKNYSFVLSQVAFSFSYLKAKKVTLYGITNQQDKKVSLNRNEI